MMWFLRMKWWWMCLIWQTYDLEVSRGAWIWVGHLGISFRRFPSLYTNLMIKNGARRGIRVSQFGPLVVTWEESR